MILEAFGITLLGLFFGSFINVVLFRLPKQKNPLMGRSECVHCLSKLKWYDLIPVLSFLFLKGRCRSCNEKIFWYYPVVELSTALSFLGVFYFIPTNEHVFPAVIYFFTFIVSKFVLY